MLCVVNIPDCFTALTLRQLSVAHCDIVIRSVTLEHESQVQPDPTPGAGGGGWDGAGHQAAHPGQRLNKKDEVFCALTV